MTVSVSAKTQTFTNGNANDAAPVESEMTALFNNDSNLKTKVDNLLSGKIEDSGTVTLNQTYSGGAPSTNGVLEIERGTAANTNARWNKPSDFWQSTKDGPF